MSLKWFHVVFISLSTLMGIAIGVWGLFNGFPVLGIASLASSAALCVYGTYFLQKARREGLA
jgi:uncharacterized membrane protein YdjX (TVP38/TMEM64 family)